MSITGWLGMSKSGTWRIFKIEKSKFVLASQTLGASKFKLIFKHILPNTLGAIVVTSMFTVPSAIFSKHFKLYWNRGACA